jgi:prepilin-type N-terminal cleavage/methylation domain-containing protein
MKVRGFSFMELLIAMSVIGILSILLVPVGRSLIDRAYRIEDRNRLQQLVLAYSMVGMDGNGADLNHIDCLKDFAVRLAQIGGANDTACWQSKSRNKTLGRPIVNRNGEDLNNLHHADWVVLYPISITDSPAMTPVFYSRGLLADGTWSPNSVYGTAGGYIAFLDGKVVFCKQASAVLVDYASGLPTKCIQNAVAPGTHAYTIDGMEW